MTFRSLASSSRGNAYMVSDGETTLLLECGLPYKKLAEKSGFTLMDTTACFVTHEHKDHSHAAGQLIKRGVPVFMSEGTARALELWDAEIIEPNVPIMVGAFRVMAFRVAHDAADPVGYLIDDTRTGERLMFAADTRSLPYIVPRLTYIAVECNYEESLLAASQRIPESLKTRIRHSHFEVRDVIRWLKKQDLSHVMTIYLLHLSAGNSRAAEWQQMFAREFPGIEIKICEEQTTMNEKHYDNLYEMAQNTSEPGARLYAELAAIRFTNADKYSQDNRSEFIRSIAILYNMLDILCIALDCEDEVQDMAEQLAAEKVLPRA